MVMKNILILTDFSDNSWNSITYTLAFFKNKSCNFYLLNGVNKHEEYFNENSTSLVKQKEKKDAKKEFDRLSLKVASSPLKGTHRFFPIIAETDIIEAARTQIKEKKIDLVVIGTNGLSYTGRDRKSVV